MTESFVYKWTSSSTGKIYIGKHKGREDDGYISSGAYFIDAYKENPGDFSREILFYGTDKECLQREQALIEESANKVGWAMMYNLTTYNRLKQWTRKCLVCGAVCYPEYENAAEAFEQKHFNSCKQLFVGPTIPKRILVERQNAERREQRKKEKVEAKLSPVLRQRMLHRQRLAKAKKDTE